ncbi:Fur family transcriptional regulator [Propioniferax innocua]|nr:transcriptional repressor [Propioniferax innocua]
MVSTTQNPRSAPQRRTKQRAAVVELLREVDEFQTAQQIHDLLRSRGHSIGLATVYRNLQAMADAGEVDVLRTDTEASYRRCTDTHHHHVVCRECGKAVEVEGPEVEKWAHDTAIAHGFVDVDHVIEIFGRCVTCATDAS